MLFAVNYAAFGVVMILFLVLEPLGLVGIWRRVQTYFLLWPFKHRPVAGAAPMSRAAARSRQARGGLPARHHGACRASRSSATQGQIVGILGTNGAGKTTLLRAISGFHGIDDARVTEGTITLQGPAHRERRAAHESRRPASRWCRSARRCFPNLTVAENLIVPVAHRASPPPNGGGARSRCMQFFPKLGDLRHRTAGLLSGGERQMLAIAGALVCKPELLLVDELSLGLAPVVVDDLMARLLQIKRELGITILLVEQSAAVALEVADYGYVLENGRIVLDGDKARLLGHPDIQEFYLGQSSGGKRRSYRDVKQYRRSRRWYG